MAQIGERRSWNTGTFEPVEVVARLMAGYPRLWFVSGGWAIDLFVDRVTREHEDLEVGVFREDQVLLYRHLSGWKLHKSAKGPDGDAWVPWDEGEWLALPIFQLLALRTEATTGVPPELAEFEFFLNDRAGDAWQFRRNPATTRPLAALTLRSRRGIPIIAPEVQLLHKARHHRPKDDHDFELARDHLSAEGRAWLKAALLTNHPDDPWLAEL